MSLLLVLGQRRRQEDDDNKGRRRHDGRGGDGGQQHWGNGNGRQGDGIVVGGEYRGSNSRFVGIEDEFSILIRENELSIGIEEQSLQSLSPFLLESLEA
ncbi:hypothetical protein AKJ16_DCAP17260 [Drosera capensis]